MGNWAWSPRYALTLRRGDGSTWSLKTLQSAQALLVTGSGVAQASFSLADPDAFIRKTVQPHPMNLIRLAATNRMGQAGVCWTGYCDEVHEAFDPDQGSGVTLSCTGPVKLFEITRQSAGDVAGLALAYSQNVAASAVLKFAARACGYPSSLLRIHPKADSGSGYQQIGAGVFTNPDQQPWSAVVSAIQANSGLEWFTDEYGAMFWRPIGFLDPWFAVPDKTRPATLRPRTIVAEDILQADFAESDQGIVTDVEVRYYGGGGFVQTAVHAPRSQGSGGPPESAAHKQMVAHLRTRRLVIYAPWILTSSGAQYLADVLFAQYSAGVAQASVTIPADPLIGIGSLVDVERPGPAGGTTRYYVSSITAQLQWTAGWTYTLGLSYGRSPAEQFPYTGKVAWPQVTADVREDQRALFPGPVSVLDASNPAWDTTPYTITAQAGLQKDQAATAAYPPGSEIQIYSKPRSKGANVGPSHHGDYTVVAPTNQAQSDTTIALLSTSVATGYVTIVAIAPASSPDTPDAPVQDVTSYEVSPQGTGYGSSAGSTAAVPDKGSLAQKAFALALTFSGGKYTKAAVGDVYDGTHRTFDCSGLTCWCYVQCGYTWGDQAHSRADGSVIWFQNAIGQYQWFAENHGGKAISVDAAQPGDLLFCGPAGNPGAIGHVAFCSKAGGLASGECFGANNDVDGIGPFALAGYKDGEGDPFAFAIDMSGVTLNS